MLLSVAQTKHDEERYSSSSLLCDCPSGPTSLGHFNIKDLQHCRLETYVIMTHLYPVLTILYRVQILPWVSFKHFKTHRFLCHASYTPSHFPWHYYRHVHYSCSANISQETLFSSLPKPPSHFPKALLPNQH